MPLRWLGKHLMIKSDYADLILEGKKRSTIRLGKVQVNNREFFINSGGKIIAKAIVKDVVYKRVKDLTDDDAKLDGFNSKEELIGELKKHYRNLKDDDVVTIIVFDVVERLNINEYKLGSYKPKEIAELALRNLPLTEFEEAVLKKIIEYGSVRGASRSLFGSIQYRWKIRNVLNKVYRMLLEKGIIKEESE